MSGLQAHVDDYLRLRRALGFKLREDGRRGCPGRCRSSMAVRV